MMLKSFLILAVSLGLSSLSPVLAQSANNDNSPSPRTAEQVVKQACDFIGSQKTFSVDLAITYDEPLPIGSKVQYSANQKLLVVKPNQLRSDYLGDERVTTFYYDGRNFTLQAPNLGFYNTKPAPATLDQLIANLEDTYGINLPMANLVVNNPCGELNAEAQATFFVGNNLVGNEETYHVLLQGEDRDFQLWISQTEPPVLKKALITYTDLPGEPQYTVVFSNWNFQPQFPQNTFTFTPAKDDVKVEMIPVDKINIMNLMPSDN